MSQRKYRRWLAEKERREREARKAVPIRWKRDSEGERAITTKLLP